MDVFLNLLAGAISGAGSRTAVAPFERLIILKQTQNPDFRNLSILSSLKRMMGVEGPASLFKGNAANCMRIAPFQAIEFFSFEKYKVLNAQLGMSDYYTFMLSGMMSGMTASTSVYPLDLIRVIFSVQTTHIKYQGILKTISQIYQEKGFFGLYRGWGTTMLGIGPYAAIKLSTFQMQKNHYYGKEYEIRNFSSMANLIMGAIAGTFAVTITYPTDVMRRRVMAMILSDEPNKESLFSLVKSYYRKDGLMSFYSGLFVTYFKVIPSTALAFTLNEGLKKLFGVSKVGKKH